VVRVDGADVCACKVLAIIKEFLLISRKLFLLLIILIFAAHSSLCTQRSWTGTLLHRTADHCIKTDILLQSRAVRSRIQWMLSYKVVIPFDYDLTSQIKDTTRST